MKNYKTTFAGLLSGGAIALDALLKAYEAGTFNSKHGVELALAIGLVLLGAYAKDHDVTGGKIAQ